MDEKKNAYFISSQCIMELSYQILLLKMFQQVIIQKKTHTHTHTHKSNTWKFPTYLYIKSRRSCQDENCLILLTSQFPKLMNPWNIFTIRCRNLNGAIMNIFQNQQLPKYVVKHLEALSKLQVNRISHSWTKPNVHQEVK